MSGKTEEEQVDINFESHPPIEDDINGVATLLRQNLFQFVDCHALASYIVGLKNATQVIAQESPEEENTSDDEEEDDDIYGVVSVIDLPTNEASLSSSKPSDKRAGEASADGFIEVRKQLLKFLRDKCPKLKESLDEKSASKNHRYGLIVSERFINLPPQLALPTFKDLTKSLEEVGYTHLIFIAKTLVKARSTETSLPSKKTRPSDHASSATKTRPKSSTQDEALVYVNPEEEIIFEKCQFHADIDVSAYCDENATWSFSSDIKYIPHRRIMSIEFKRWPEILKALDDELN